MFIVADSPLESDGQDLVDTGTAWSAVLDATAATWGSDPRPESLDTVQPALANDARFAAVLCAAEDFLNGGACRTQVLLTVLQDSSWHEVPAAFAVAVFRACRDSMPRASLAEEFSKIVDLVVLSACGSLEHDAIHSWVLSNWNVFARGIVEVLLEILGCDTVTLQPARAARARRAFQVAIALAGAVRKYMALDTLKSTNGAHALLAVCDNDENDSGSLLRHGYTWSNPPPPGGYREHVKRACHLPISYAHALLMEELALAIERAEPGVNDIGTWKTAFGYFASSTKWRAFARRCKSYIRSKNKQLPGRDIPRSEPTERLLERAEDACELVRASARLRVRSHARRLSDDAPSPERPAERAQRTPSAPERAHLVARIARFREELDCELFNDPKRPRRQGSNTSSSASSDSDGEGWMERTMTEAFGPPGAGGAAGFERRGNGAGSPQLCRSADADAGRALASKLLWHDDVPSEPSLPSLPSELWGRVDYAPEPEEQERAAEVARNIECAQRAIGDLRGLATKGLEQARRLESAGFASECTDELLQRERRSDNGHLARRLRFEHLLVQSTGSRLFSSL